MEGSRHQGSPRRQRLRGAADFSRRASPHPSIRWRFPDPRGWRRELKKQLGDQALHWAWGAATGALPFLLALVPAPLGWWLCAQGTLLALVSIWAMVIREVWQLGNGTDRWWDAPLDWLFLALGVRDGLAIGAVVFWAL